MTIQTLFERKASAERITAITAYDYPTALLVDGAGVDMILVGDSLGNVILGYENTLPVTMDEMVHHVKAVRRGVKRALLVADMPFMSYQASVEDAVRNAGRFVKECGAEAVKVEGAGGIVSIVRAIVDSGIPVLGHIGFTPQWILQLGGPKVRGRRAKEAAELISAAIELERAGCFGVVLECVPAKLSKVITERLSIPTIGIGSGADCDGQILVFHDLVGLLPTKTPKHAKRYLSAYELMDEAVKSYIAEVKDGLFPTVEHSFEIDDEVIVEALREVELSNL
ncbi:MAG: 3-methyl-2-oxobutanoate hydroxymethyltransferase [Armatimonadota bacterium]|nr:3-methyl-2-oxobutanoate hydroxymethyltransferase [Armatimonadota bacterium]MDW8026074.1 3-methyl-2-oxobutanoate hydroxymethyltransferase [Armatimonadota bacterium]